MAAKRPTLEFLRGQVINGSDSQVGDFAVIKVFRGLKDTFGFSE